MKNIITIIALSIAPMTFAQVIIGTGKTAPTNTSVSLEFGTENKGILLPMVDSESAVAGAVPGTIIYDGATKKAKVKLTSSWKDLTIDNTGTAYTTPANTGEASTAKVSVGTPTSTPGILVLEDSNKAMILPTVNAYTDIVSPSAGMMVYVKSVKQVAFYNGSVWTFWKP